MIVQAISSHSYDLCDAPAQLGQGDPWLPPLSPPKENVWQAPARQQHEMLTEGASARQLDVYEATFRSMQAKIDELSREVKELRRRTRERPERFRSMSNDMEQTKTSFYQEWIKNNLDELRKYAGEHIALDPEKGIIAHAPDQASFARQLKELSPAQEKHLIIFHASLYV